MVRPAKASAVRRRSRCGCAVIAPWLRWARFNLRHRPFGAAFVWLIEKYRVRSLCEEQGRSVEPNVSADVQTKRIDSIDFWRGGALAAILVSHIPGNILGALTPRNFAFSDAAEIFVFLSGASVYLAFAERFRRDRVAASCALLRRAFRLYGAHVALTAAAIALFGLVSSLTPFDILLVESGRAAPYADPFTGFAGLLALTHQLAYFNILPLYIVLIAISPGLLALLARGRGAMLAVSLTVYAVARLADVNFPSWPEPGGWYFNPLAWQLMFALGLLCGGALRGGGVVFNPPAYAVALIFSVGSALVVSDFAGLSPGFVDAAGRYLDWSKTNLGLARIVGFLALAYALYFSGLTARLRKTPLFGFFSMLGRHALPVFCFGSLLSAVGQILGDGGLASPLFDIAYVAAALTLLYLVAERIERAKGRHPPALVEDLASDLMGPRIMTPLAIVAAPAIIAPARRRADGANHNGRRAGDGGDSHHWRRDSVGSDAGR